ncbi:MAG: 8-amino-7-oxononanoate synthase [Candidatus Omnitrophica bacterium]|nr:8-amino-7-oxononanoate synthase [Candidatus Omnitrophota bacterium]
MDKIEKLLRERRKNGLLRALKPNSLRKEGKIYFGREGFIDFSSNDYLGYSSHPKIKESASRAQEELGVGSSASRLLSGDPRIYHKLEEKIAAFKDKESALVFNSGYHANIGIISSLYGRGDVIFIDRLSHASIIDGVILSGARFFRFRHNDCQHLKDLLRKERDNFRDALIITETVFSMDGDRPPLKEIVGLKDKYNAFLMVDEAHATGIFGRKGSGIAEEEGLTKRIELIMGTFSKALGSFGAYLACSKKIKDYLINCCRSFIYSTALPPAVIAANMAAVELVQKDPLPRTTLLKNADYLRSSLLKKGFQVRGISQIVPLIVKDAKEALARSLSLQKKGYWVLPIRPPTVAEGESRLRFSLNYHHSREALERLVSDI